MESTLFIHFDVNMILIVFLIALVIISLSFSIKNISEAFSYRKKMKPDTALDCHFFISKIHPKTEAIESMICKHPRGKDLKNNPDRNCVKSCKFGIQKNENMSDEKALSYSDSGSVVLFEMLRFLSSLVPTIIAIMKILEKQ